MNLFTEITRRVFGAEINRQVREALAVETDAAFTVGARLAGAASFERADADREEILAQVLEAWRVNPLARRMVELTTQYVLGGGVAVSCKQRATAAFLDQFWRHRLNQMEVRLSEWSDELARSGNLFVLISTDAGGMSYARALPAAKIARIETAPNDSQQETAYLPKPTLEVPDPRPWAAYDALHDAPDADGGFSPVMLHYAVNRPVGSCWGESDLAPQLRWLARYANWLEDRARLNRFRTAFLYAVKARFASEAQRAARQQQLNASKPAPGSILVMDESETWEVLHPRLEADDANEDGLALKKMIAAGAGVPLHFLAEPESSTRTTAEAAGGPTFRRFEQRQQYFLWLVVDMLRVVTARRARVDRRVDARAAICVQGADISVRDNLAMAQAAASLAGCLTDLRDRRLIDDAELLRLVYRFAGEALDVEEMLARAARQEGCVSNEKGGIHGNQS